MTTNLEAGLVRLLIPQTAAWMQMMVPTATTRAEPVTLTVVVAKTRMVLLVAMVMMV